MISSTLEPEPLLKENKIVSESLFAKRHIGPSEGDIAEMLSYLKVSSLEELIERAVPKTVLSRKVMRLPQALSERQALQKLKELAEKNKIFKSYIGMGYYDTFTPPVIKKNILENPGWYTAYTPYQAEIAQGRLEALLNFQTMVEDLTALPVANASLLDESTAAAEAMLIMRNLSENNSSLFLVSNDCFPQTLAVVSTRAKALGIEVEIAPEDAFDFSKRPFGILVQYPTKNGLVKDYESLCQKAHAAGAYVSVASDLLSLTLFKAPGEFGADIALGSTQRFGIPMGGGGPHAAYLATKDEFKRHMPGRIVGVSKDSSGKTALRLSLQTREQHIRREKATSNICTAQVLLAVAAGAYAVYHGPKGLRQIAERIRQLAQSLAEGLQNLGFESKNKSDVFDTLFVSLRPEEIGKIRAAAEKRKMNFWFEKEGVGISLGETSAEKDVLEILSAFASIKGVASPMNLPIKGAPIPEPLKRKSNYLAHPVFNSYHSETEMMRYLKRLENRDLSLVHSMISLGSCTMKLNAASEMEAMTWPEFAQIHPYAPQTQTRGYQALIKDLERRLCAITGFEAFSFQPNAGSQGEYAGLLAIKRYHENRGERQRNVCLIPASAHGTNPASAALAGLSVVVVSTTENGDIDVADLKSKAEEFKERLAALMVTYPSTHGVFEAQIRESCSIVHKNGGLVYLDGANMNALVGLGKPAELGADVCHLNLHKTFAIPHGGGGPGMGPIGVTKTLKPYLPGNPLDGENSYAVSSAPWGSASILTISWAYIAQMGYEGLLKATQVAILNANYLARKLETAYPILFKGPGGWSAHECIIELRPLKNSAEVTAEDIAKRLMDYGFHAPTVSFPVPGTMMIEPTESESKAEIDRFSDAMISIRAEIREIEEGRADKANNLLKNAPHTLEQVCSDRWDKPYGREKAAFPLPQMKDRKFWPAVSRIDNAWGDRNFFCSCPPWGDGGVAPSKQ